MSVQHVSSPEAQPTANGDGSHRLKSLAISRGFLDGIRFELADGLNCLIGGRGTGKTTALELVRYVMDALPGREEDATERKRIESLVEKNLAGGIVELEVETKDGFCYLVSRAYGEEPLVLTPDRRPTELSVRSGGLFRVDIFSQNAVERLADESNSQLDLLDAFEAEAIADITAHLAQLRSTLAANAAQIVPLQANIAAMKEDLNRLPVVEEKLRAYATGDGDDAGEIDRAHGLKALRDREQRAVAGVAGALAQLRGETARLRGRLAGQTAGLIDGEMIQGPNGALLREIVGCVQHCAETLDSMFMEAGKRLEDVERQVADHGRQLGLAHKEQELAFRALVEKHEQAQGQVAERTRLEKLRNELLARRRDRDAAGEQLSALQDERRRLLDSLSELHDRRFALREAVAQRLTAQLAPAIRVSVLQYGNPEMYQTLLESKLRGGRLKHVIVTGKLIAALWPAELTRLVRAKDIRALIDRAELNPEQAEKVVACLGVEEALMELETVELLDRPRIELRDGETYKDCSELSTGQKCTAILPILLLDSDRPLLVDQPEDNLDNRFIFETVVDSVRKIKGRRQLVFVTHNPNIPVLGEAEKVFVLQSDGKAARKANEGSVDRCKDEIVTLLEGGEEAFKRRRARYAY